MNTELDFWAKAAAAPYGCIVWTASKVDGYGQFRFSGKRWKSHILAYNLMVGPVPAGLQLDHLCRNRACINHFHLEPVTPKENVRRGDRTKLWTHCRRGHELTADNVAPNGATRTCRTCRRESSGTQKRLP